MSSKSAPTTPVTRKERNSFMSPVITKVRQSSSSTTTPSSAPTKKRKRDNNNDNDDDNTTTNSASYKKFMYRATLETMQLGKEKLKGKEKLAEEARIAKLQGGTVQAAPKMPLPMLLGMQKSQKERQEKRRIFLQDMGAYVAPTKKKDKNATSVEDYVRKKVFDRSGLGFGIGSGKRGLKASIGKFSNGTLTLSQRDIDSVSSERSGAGGLGFKQKRGKKKR